MDEIDKRLTSRVSGKRTICEVHREIYDILYEFEDSYKKSKAIKLLEEAFLMAKKMNDRLFEYQKDWNKGFFNSEFKTNIAIKKDLRNKRKK